MTSRMEEGEQQPLLLQQLHNDQLRLFVLEEQSDGTGSFADVVVVPNKAGGGTALPIVSPFFEHDKQQQSYQQQDRYQHQYQQQHHPKQEQAVSSSSWPNATADKKQRNKYNCCDTAVRSTGRQVFLFCYYVSSSNPITLLALIAAGVLLSGTSGGFAYFYRQWSQLRSETHRLETSNDRYAQLNDQLNASNAQLNQTVYALETQVIALGTENKRYARLNEDMKENTLKLNETAQLLMAQVENLTQQNNRYRQLNLDLVSIVSFLNHTSNNMDESLTTVTSFLSQQIQTSQQLVVESLQNLYLQRISNWECRFFDYFKGETFLQQNQFTSSSSLSSSSSIIGSEHIDAVLQYVQHQVLSELCLHLDDFVYFIKERHGNDSNPSEERVSSNGSSFSSSSLSSSSPYSSLGSFLSVDLLISGMQRYTLAAMSFYFPDNDDNEQMSATINANTNTDTNPGKGNTSSLATTTTASAAGVTVQDWVDASFACHKLPAALQFRMYNS